MDENVTSISAPQLAKRWNISVKTLSSWRTYGGGPKFFYANEANKSSVRYPLKEIEAHEQRLYKHTV
jgi:hypothetical protein